MSVTDGDKGNAATFNSSYMSREVDTSTAAKIDLLDADAASGTTVTNVQRELNGGASFVGDVVNGLKDRLPTWVSNAVGTASDSLKARCEALTVQVGTNTTDLAAISNGSEAIGQTSFSGLASQTDADITGLVFDNSVTESASVEYTIKTATKFEKSRFDLIWDGSSWDIHLGAMSGDDSGIVLTVNTSTGQVRYTSGLETSTIKFKATTFDI